jgi:hypothetical protein
MAKVMTEKLLARVLPDVATPVLAYTPPDANTQTVIKSFKVVNTSASTARFSVMFVPSGEEVDATTAVFWDVELEAGETLSDETFMALNLGDALYVQTDAPDDVVFWFWGYEVVTT